MKYIITGATGHIGNTVVRKLVQENCQVKVLVRRIDESIKDLPIEFVKGNVFDEKFLQENIENDSIVIHLAGIIDAKNKLKDETYQINYLGTKTITDVCLAKKVKKYIYFSSVDAIYKDGSGSIIKEPSFLEVDKLKSYYGYSKALATNYVLEKQKEGIIPIDVLYPSAVIGVNDFKPSLIGKVMIDCLHNKMQFGIKGGYNFVDVEDIANFTYLLCQSDRFDSYILSAHQVSAFEMYQTFNKAIGNKRKTFRIPIWLAKLAIPFVPYLSKFAINTLLDKSKYDSSKAVQAGFVITPFEKTVEKAIAWHKNHLEEKKNVA